MTAQLLLVIDMQTGVLSENGRDVFGREALISLVNRRIAAYREAQKPIIFVQHNDPWLLKGSEDWQIVNELDMRAGDMKLDKTHANSFYQTGLQAKLQELGVTSLEICGAQTEFCVDTTIKFAHGLGYALTMVHHASSTFDNAQMTGEETIEFYENLWNERFLSFISEN